MPAQKRRPHEAVRPPLDASNETSRAFLGVQRRAWMMTTGSDVPAVALSKSCAQTGPEPPPVVISPSVFTAPPNATSVFPSPVNSSVSSPEASTSGPGTAGSPSIVDAPPSDSDMIAAPPTAQVPSPPSFDPPPAHVTSASVDVEGRDRVLADESGSGSENLPMNLVTTHQNVTAAAKRRSTTHTELTLSTTSAQLEAPSAAEANTTPRATQPNSPNAATNLMTPRHQPAHIQGRPSSEVPGTQPKRHCSPASRQLVAAHNGNPVNFHHLYAVIESRLRDFQGANLPSQDAFFYKLLVSACSRGDFFYLVFHQAFCLWSLNNQHAYAFLQAKPQVADSAFHILLRIWRQNSDISLTHLWWFASFPVTLASTETDPCGTQRRRIPHHQVTGFMPLINKFLEKLALSWSLVLVQVVQRGYPLMAWELNRVLECASPVLRWVLFICSRKAFGIREGPATQDLGRLFEIDWRNESARAFDSPETVQMRKVTRDRYIAIIQEARGSLLNHGSAANQQLLLAQQAASMQNTLSTPQHWQHVASLSPFHPTPMALPTLSPPYNNGSHAVAPQVPVMDGNTNVGVAQGLTQPHQVSSGFSSSPSVAGRGQTQTAGVFTSPVTSNMQAQAASYLTQTETAVQQIQMMLATQRPVSLATNCVVQRTATVSVPPGRGPNPYPQQQLAPQAIQPQQIAPRATQPQQIAPQATQLQQTSPQAMQPAAGWSRARLLPRHTPQVAHPPCPEYRTATASGQAGVRVPPTDAMPSQHQVSPLHEHQIPRDDWSRAQTSLHLSYLRSPKRACSTPSDKRYYQFMTHFAAVPQAFTPQPGLRILRFSLSQDEASNLVTSPPASDVPMALFRDGSLRYRLRLCKQSQATQQVQERVWTGCSTYWPPHIFLECNDQSVQPRRRQHFQYDLPIELTGLLRSGENSVRVSLPRVGNGDQDWTYFMGVEVIKTLDHDTVRAMVESNSRTSAEETKRKVNQRLKQDDSNDIIAQDEHICVAVTDPFSSSLFTTPVRGADCKHLECFDLDIWLRTRPGRHSGSGNKHEPSTADCWKCPICDLDARPVCLHIDDFFTEVRAKLVEDGEDAIKKISIQPDGTWSPLPEADEAEEAVMSPATSGHERPGLPQAARSASVQAIVIDDD
ncbi:hypothetical protein XA68_15255 [Ophiocordyceps unilateralis]|uniref:Uncharacterized protein n=1 Tax=Ophiocordyceps unilateralis TaxID=268505 RepID=A0A2A9P6Z8_OPHUN|nr:hypothetical protein XA68_15255 [Ophiocordyceps unilateralis]